MFVSEAFGGAPNLSATSSYKLDSDGQLTTISASVGTNQTANCWVVVTPNGQFAYVTNTGSGSISGVGLISRAGSRCSTPMVARASLAMAAARSTSRSPTAAASSTASTAATRASGRSVCRPTGSLTSLPFTGGLSAAANGLGYFAVTL